MTVKNFLKKFLMIIGAITIFSIFMGMATGIFFWISKEDVSDKTFLELNFDKELVEYVGDDPTALMMGKTPQVLDVVEALQIASDDERVLGIIARVSRANMGFARVQEVRDAVLAFRKKGKTAIAYADTFGEFGPGNRAYYLATAFEKIFLQPSGDIGLTGLIWETQFLKGTLKKIGVVPRMDQRHEYKNAMNIFTEEKYTEPHKEAVSKVMMSVFGQIVREIAEVRKLSEEDVLSITDHGLFLGQEAVNAKLVDELAYRDKVYGDIEEKVGDVTFLPLLNYLEKAGRLYTEGETIALIYGVGGIARGKSRHNHLSGDEVMGSETITRAFRSAIKDDEVRAILFRVSSPGGSYVASDSIWRETVRAKASGKPVIVSMGDVAGSGGYFVAMAADKIVAQPGTITGSIGVLAGKMLTPGLWEKLGISWDEVHTSQNATLWSGIHDYTPVQWNLFQGALDRIYGDFTGKVEQGRGLSGEKVAEIAKGRIWTGEDAKELGLVDELGGFPLAIRLAKKAAGIPENEAVRLKIFPKRKNWMEMLMKEGAVSSEEKTSAMAMAQALQEIQPLIRSLRQTGLLHPSGVLSMPNLGSAEMKF